MSIIQGRLNASGCGRVQNSRDHNFEDPVVVWSMNRSPVGLDPLHARASIDYLTACETMGQYLLLCHCLDSTPQ